MFILLFERSYSKYDRKKKLTKVVYVYARVCKLWYRTFYFDFEIQTKMHVIAFGVHRRRMYIYIIHV